MKPKTVVFLHEYLEEREAEIGKGLFPDNHYWGKAGMLSAGWNVKHLKTRDGKPITRLGQWLTKLTRNRLGDFHAEIKLICKARKADIIYSFGLHLFFVTLLRKLRFIRSKVVIWVFREPAPTPWWQFRNLDLSRWNLSGCDGILCLTQRCETAFKARSPRSNVKHIPWGIDTGLFFPDKKSSSEYFLAVGKTGRDYPTFLRACSKTNSNFRIIAPDWSTENIRIPPNVDYLKTNPNVPDGTISYPDLRKWYAGCIATCIPLQGDPEDTCGYTNLLEAMAMGKAVLMTKSGSLDIDIEALGIGFWVKPQDAEDWCVKFDLLLANPDKTKQMGRRGFKLASTYYHSTRFEEDVASYLEELSDNGN